VGAAGSRKGSTRTWKKLREKTGVHWPKKRREGRVEPGGLRRGPEFGGGLHGRRSRGEVLGREKRKKNKRGLSMGIGSNKGEEGTRTSWEKKKTARERQINFAEGVIERKER